MYLHSSKVIFDSVGVGRVLNKLGKVVKPKARPPIMQRNKVKRVSWARKYMKVDFYKVIFTDECPASLDGPDIWSKCWILHDESVRSSDAQATTGRKSRGGRDSKKNESDYRLSDSRTL